MLVFIFISVIIIIAATIGGAIWFAFRKHLPQGEEVAELLHSEPIFGGNVVTTIEKEPLLSGVSKVDFAL